MQPRNYGERASSVEQGLDLLPDLLHEQHTSKMKRAQPGAVSGDAYIHKRLRAAQLRPFQQSVADSAGQDDECTVNCLHCKDRQGTTFMIDYLDEHDKAVKIPVGFLSICDIRKVATDIMSSGNITDPRLVLFDVPRAITSKAMAKLAVFADQTKSGTITSTRRPRTWTFKPPTVWVVVHNKAHVTGVDSGKWKFWHIDDITQELVPGFDSDDNKRSPN